MRRRLLVSTGLIALVAVLVLGVPLGIVGTRLLTQRAESRLERDADEAAVALGRRLRVGQPVDAAAVRALARAGDRLDVVLPDGRRVAAGADVGSDPLRAQAARAGALRVTALAPAAERTDDVGGVWLTVIVLSLLAVGTAVGLALLQARRLAAPMERLAAGVERVAEPGVTVDAAPSGIAELDAIGAALADADRRVEDVLRREREFSDNASHQLRTPLAGVRMRLEELRALATSAEAAAEADAALAQVDRLVGTIEHLEALARGRDPEPVATADLARVVAEHVEVAWAPRFASAGRALSAAPRDGVLGRLAPEAARQVVDVLLDNALRHGGGATAVRLSATGGWALLRVRDEGPGVPPERAEALFERGVSSGSGGVGLAVARELVRREGGELSLVHARPACFEAAVPAAAR